jgi:hypothetical protein
MVRAMTKPPLILWTAFLAATPSIHAEGLDNAEVRLPYGELKQLLTRAEPATKPAVPRPALLSARLRLSVENDRPVINATFRVTSFSSEPPVIPLVAGDLTLEKQDPEDAAIVADGNSLCLAAASAGVQTLQLRLLPVLGSEGFSLSFPPCPSAILETVDLPADRALVLRSGDTEETLATGQLKPLPNTSQSFTIRMLDPQETHEAMRPPEPSEWTWQHQALVKPSDDGLIYQIAARASAAGGSGIEATLPLPSDARDINVSGEDLVSQTQVRGGNRSLALNLAWKTRGILDRQLMITYRMPLRPLDPSWHLQAPGGDGTMTRFIIATSPLLTYSADGLSSPLTSQGLPAILIESLGGGTCQHLEGATSATLKVASIPVAATAGGVVKEAEWSMRIEPDGAVLLSGTLAVEHKNPLEFVFDTPDGMKLLTCEAGGKPVSPVDLGAGNLKVTLPAAAGKSLLSCSFTGTIAPLDPVEGTMKLSLPKVPLFIHSLSWHLDLPAGYQSETHGNLKRSTAANSGPPSRISLTKNLCRDERPEVNVFYQRIDLNR